MHLATGGFDLFASGNEVRPIRALYQDVRQERGDELARRVFLEECHGVDGFQMESKRGACLFAKEWPGRALKPLHARIGIECENKYISERTRTFEQADMARMQDVIAAVREYNLFGVSFPEMARGNQLAAAIESRHPITF